MTPKAGDIWWISGSTIHALIRAVHPDRDELEVWLYDSQGGVHALTRTVGWLDEWDYTRCCGLGDACGRRAKRLAGHRRHSYWFPSEANGGPKSEAPAA